MITREIFRTSSLEVSETFHKKVPLSSRKISEKISYKLVKENEKHLPLIKNYLRLRLPEDKKRLKTIFPFLTDDLDQVKQLIKLINLSNVALSKLKLQVKEGLVEKNIALKEIVLEYIFYETIQNKFDHTTIIPEKYSYRLYLLKIKTLLAREGFRQIPLPWVVSYKENFSFLGFEDRDLRVVSESQNYYINKLVDSESKLLKPHCTGIMLTKIRDLKDPLSNRYFSISKVFRRETTDSTHSCSFDQLQITVCTDLNKSTAEVLEVFRDTYDKVISILGVCTYPEKIKVYPTYYPYTTPSLEFYTTGKEVELGGGGIFNFNFIDGKKVIGMAMGLQRCYMAKEGLTHIKDII